MNKKLLKLKYLEEQEVTEELKKIENAEKCFKNYSFFNLLGIMFFIMSMIMVITACFYKTLLIGINDSLISLVVLVFTMLSIISLVISAFYNSKTMSLVKKYYNNIC